MNESLHIAGLIAKKIKGEISSAEQKELDLWIQSNPDNKAIFNRAVDTGVQLNKLEVYNLFRKEKVWTQLEDELFATKTVRFTPRTMIRYAAAILLPLMVLGGLAYIFLNNPAPQTLADIDSLITPGTQKAMLILSDGKQVELEGEAPQSDIQEGKTRIRNENKLLRYFTGESEEQIEELVFNELKTPRGGGYKLQLADGTSVWLNAGSSLRFPVSFTDSTRQVFLEGEAYFEVSHNGKPFLVNSGDMDIRVLGTSFNVTAYSDESELKATLIEGKVSVTYSQAGGVQSFSRILSPDQQAVIDRSGSEISIAEVNTSQYTSWMQGKLEFNNEHLEQVMKRLSRWYDFSYEFENSEAKDYHFTARLDREESISSILKMLEMTTDVKFELREDKIVVL